MEGANLRWPAHCTDPWRHKCETHWRVYTLSRQPIYDNGNQHFTLQNSQGKVSKNNFFFLKVDLKGSINLNCLVKTHLHFFVFLNIYVAFDLFTNMIFVNNFTRLQFWKKKLMQKCDNCKFATNSIDALKLSFCDILYAICVKTYHQLDILWKIYAGDKYHACFYKHNNFKNNNKKNWVLS